MAEAESGMFAKLYTAAGERLGRRLFEELRAASSLRPRWTLARIGAYAIATLVHGITIALVLGAIAAVLLIHALFGWIVAAFLLALAWVLRPRFDFGRFATGLGIEPSGDILGKWRTRLSALSEDDRARLRARARAKHARLDSTHPPTADRIALVLAHPVLHSKVSLSSAESAAIDAELARHEERVRAELADQAASVMYHG